MPKLRCVTLKERMAGTSKRKKDEPVTTEGKERSDKAGFWINSYTM